MLEPSTDDTDCAPEPLNVTVLVPELKVPLLDQLPFTLMLLAFAVKVDKSPIVTFPFTSRVCPPVFKVLDAPTERLPLSVVAVPSVTVPVPEVLRLLYVE